MQQAYTEKKMRTKQQETNTKSNKTNKNQTKNKQIKTKQNINNNQDKTQKQLKRKKTLMFHAGHIEFQNQTIVAKIIRDTKQVSFRNAQFKLNPVGFKGL